MEPWFGILEVCVCVCAVVTEETELFYLPLI